MMQMGLEAQETRIITPSPTLGVLDRVHIGLIVVIAVLFWWMNPTAFIAEDSYFYLVAARRLGLDWRHSFSGIFPTNGVHPLYYYLLSLYSFVVGRISPQFLWNAAYAVPLAAFLVGVGAYNFAVSERNLGLRAGTLVIPPLVFIAAMGVLCSEAHVLYCTLSLFARISSAKISLSNKWHALLAGIVLSLVFLSRLDMLFLVVAFTASLVLRERVHWRKALWLGAGFAVLAVPYLVSNRIVFGGYVPVSGWLKSSFPSAHLTGFSMSDGLLHASLSQYNFVFGVIPVLLSWAVVVTPRFRHAPSLHALGIPLVVGATCHMAYTMLFSSWCAWYWYYVLPMVSGAFFTAVLLAQPLKSALPACSLRLGFTLLFLAVLLAGRRGDRRCDLVRAMQRVMDTYDLNHSVTLVSEFPGSSAFRSHSNVIAADMLTGSRPQYEAMVGSPNALQYLLDEARANGKPVEYLLWVGGDFLKWDKASGDIVYRDPRVINRDREIGRIHVGKPLHEDPEQPLALWRLQSPKPEML